MFARAVSTVFSVCAVAALLGGDLRCQDWPHWRGPNFNGSTTATDLPTEFDQDKNVVWATDLPGPGAATPIVVGDRIFLSSVDSDAQKLLAMCIDRRTGEVSWSHDAGSRSGVAGGRRSNFASPSATTDGETVVFFFGNGQLLAYDVDGAEKWRRNIQHDYGEFAFQWTFSATPSLWRDRLVLPVLQRDTPVGRRRRPPAESTEPIPSFVLVMDPQTGETLHKVERPSPARVESRESYATPIPYIGADGREELLIVGGDVLTGHDPATGDELWRWGTWNEAHRQRSWRLVPSVVTGGGLAVVCAPKGAPAYAIRLGGDGDLSADALAWQSTGRRNPVTSDVPTPAYSDGHFYVLSDLRSALSKVSAADGAVVWTTKMPGQAMWRASPTVADDKIWCINHAGVVVVVGGESGNIVQQAAMGDEDDDQTRSSIVVAHDQLLIRTNRKLFCVGS